jgi:transcriptional regulator with XRE-family HTH domain
MHKCLISREPFPIIGREEVSAVTTKAAERTKPKGPGKVTRPRKAKTPTPNEEGIVATLRKKLGLSRRQFSRLTGYSERAIVNWEKGRTPDEPALRRITEIERLQARLSQVIKPAFIAEWLSTPNEEFDGLKPLEVIERGEIDRLWDMIFYLESGIAS